MPIGPEVSAVVGNFLLRPVDGSLEANRHEYLRWSDDILAFGRTIESCQDSIVVVDDVLSNLRLGRSVEKTLPFDNVSDAKRNLQDRWLTSLTDVLRLDDDVGMEALRSAHDSQIRGHPEVKRDRFHWVLRALKNKRDPYGCLSLARDPSLMNVDPQLSSQYLAEAGLKDTRVVDAVMDRLSKPAEDRFDGLDLHLSKHDAASTFRGRRSNGVQKHCDRFVSPVAGPRLRLGRLRQKYATLSGADGCREGGDDSSASARHDREPKGP